MRVSRYENLDCLYRTTEFGFTLAESKKSLISNDLLIPITNIQIALNLLKREKMNV